MRGRETAPDARDVPDRGIAYLTVAEVAQRLGTHRNTIERWYRCDPLPAQARVAAAEAMDRVMANRKIGG